MMNRHVLDIVEKYILEVKRRNLRGILACDRLEFEKVLNTLSRYGRDVLLLTSNIEDLSKYGMKIDVVEIDKYREVLGHEYDYVIIDLRKSKLNPNMVCTVSETIRSGGVLTLYFEDMYSQNIGRFGVRYDKYIKLMLEKCECCLIIHKNDVIVHKIPNIELKYSIQEFTDSQRRCLEIFEKFMKDIKKKVLIIRGGRGRGKTFLLGYLTYILFTKYNIPFIELIYPSEDIPDSYIKGLEKASGKDAQFSKNMIKIDEYTVRIVEPGSKIVSPIVMIDEASRIGISRFRKILSKCYKVIITITTYGYEGTGKYYEHYIQNEVLRKGLGIVVDLYEPVRYCINDPLERWLNYTYVLDSSEDYLDFINLEKLKFKIVDKDYLIKDVEYFRRLITILRDAHYRYSPDDIEYILDSDEHILFTCEYDGKPVAVAHVRVEHSTKKIIDKAISGSILPGLSTFTILSRYGTSSIYRFRIWRIHRIAVHSRFQRRGIGSRLLKYIEDIAKVRGIDIISSLFSRSEVLKFWFRNMYKPFYISPRFNKVTGDYNYGVLKPISDRCIDFVVGILQDFKRRLILLASSVYRDLDSEILTEIILNLDVKSSIKLSISSLQDRRRSIFLKYFENYEVEYVQDVAYIKLVEYLLNSEKYDLFSKSELVALICKIIQGKSIKDVAASLNIDEISARDIVKNAVKKILNFRL